MRNHSSPRLPLTQTGRALAPLIDHTLLKADASPRDVERICAEARCYGFAAVCLNPALLPVAAQELEGTLVKPCTVVGFPLGATPSATKAFEAEHAVKHGARELDMVLAIWALKDGRCDTVLEDVAAVVRAAGAATTVKVILEICLLTDPEKVAACRLAVEAGAHFVKTSTGMASGGATVEAVRLMRRTVGPEFGVKASGGIRSLADAQVMIAAGANRLGTSAGVKIVTEPERP
jgi:deoxyribose-phosphate aldolase